MTPTTGKWTLGLALLALGLLILAALASSAVAAPLNEWTGSTLAAVGAGVERAPVVEAFLLATVGLLTIALLVHTERAR